MASKQNPISKACKPKQAQLKADTQSSISVLCSMYSKNTNLVTVDSVLRSEGSGDAASNVPVGRRNFAPKMAAALAGPLSEGAVLRSSLAQPYLMLFSTKVELSDGHS